jgi:hypothetical protein
VAVMVNNKGLRLVKIRVVQDRIPELGDKFCLTDDHDVLTNNGWKSIKDVTLEDRVCTLNDKQELEYSNPSQLYEFDCQNEDLYHIDDDYLYDNIYKDINEDFNVEAFDYEYNYNAN